VNEIISFILFMSLRSYGSTILIS